MKTKKQTSDERREKIARFVEAYYVANCRPPSIREIQKAVKLSSTSVTSYHINALVADERLINIGAGARNIAPAWVPQALSMALR